MLSLFLRNLFFTILQPGLVAALIPYWILKDTVHKTFDQPFDFHHYLAILLFVSGLVITLECISRFAIEGRGTLSPADPTKKLVIRGLYKYSRNPMYVGVMMILIGEAVFFQSNNLFIYLLFIFFAFNMFIVLIEEPRLRKDFGTDYYQYFGQVRRWF